MKTTELRKLIREEVRKVISEGRVVKMKLYALMQSEDGDFYGANAFFSSNKEPFVYIEASTDQRAKQLADEYTDGQFTRYPGFYNLKKITIEIYK